MDTLNNYSDKIENMREKSMENKTRQFWKKGQRTWRSSTYSQWNENKCQWLGQIVHQTLNKSKIEARTEEIIWNMAGRDKRRNVL